MAKGRPPKPTNLLELSGAYKKHPERRKQRTHEPKPVDGPLPPFQDMEGKTQEAAWELLLACIPPGVVTPTEWPVLYEVSRLMFLSWNDACTASERNTLAAYFGKFGMTPSDRARMQFRSEKPKNRWSSGPDEQGVG